MGESGSTHLDIIVRSYFTPILSGGFSPSSPVAKRHGSAFRFSTQAKKFACSTRTAKVKTALFGRLTLAVRVGRIELPSHPWQGRVIPLNYTRNYIIIDLVRFSFCGRIGPYRTCTPFGYLLFASL